jgi:lambda repressor-like predicted transcriptional regulator
MDRDGLAAWVRSEAKKRGWSFVELSRRASVSIGSIYATTQRQRDSGFQLCAKIADAFGVPRERALHAAGLLPPVIAGGEDDKTKLELDEYWMYLSTYEREVITSLAQVFYEKQAQRRVEDEVGNEETIPPLVQSPSPPPPNRPAVGAGRGREGEWQP